MVMALKLAQIILAVIILPQAYSMYPRGGPRDYFPHALAAYGYPPQHVVPLVRWYEPSVPAAAQPLDMLQRSFDGLLRSLGKPNGDLENYGSLVMRSAPAEPMQANYYNQVIVKPQSKVIPEVRGLQDSQQVPGPVEAPASREVPKLREGPEPREQPEYRQNQGDKIMAHPSGNIHQMSSMFPEDSDGSSASDESKEYISDKTAETIDVDIAKSSGAKDSSILKERSHTETISEDISEKNKMIKQGSHPETVAEDISGKMLKQRSHTETVDEDIGGKIIKQSSHIETIAEDTSANLIKQRSHTVAEDTNASNQNEEVGGNALELEEEYELKRERDTEWDQSDYDPVEWDDTNDIDEVNVQKKLRNRPITFYGDTYVNDLLAAKGAKTNPDAEFIPPSHNTDREEVEYEDLIPHLRRRPNYHGDTNVNNILASRNTPINPDAEFIPPSSKYSTPIQVHYGYEIEDINPVDLKRDIEGNNILASQNAPTKPDAEIVEFNYNYNSANSPVPYNHGEYFGDTYVNEILKKDGSIINPDAELINFPYREVSEPKQRGQYSGDTYVNEILAERGEATNPNAEIFIPEEVIEFVPLETEQFEFEHDLRGDTNVNTIAKSRGVSKNPDAEELDQEVVKYRN